MKTVELCLKSKGLPAKYWESALSDALPSTRSLINMVLNEMPH